MRWRLCFTAFLATVSHHTAIVRAAPELAFPINSQVPPVALASQAYSFTFSPSTFKSDQTEILYSLRNAPAWLSLDSVSRTLKGTPAASDVGAGTFELNAEDEDGQTPSRVTLVVLKKPNIQPGRSILPSLQEAGPVSAPATLLLKPLAAFEIRFSSAAFTGISGGTTTYYAISSDDSPLPPWVQFDPMTLTFSGTGPSLVSPKAPQQIYGIHLVATDVPGFAEAILSFQIAVSYHTFSFADTVKSLPIKSGQSFASPSFRDSLTLDGEPVAETSIASVTADVPPWASLNAHDVSIGGTPPEKIESQVVSIHAQDVYGDLASITITLENAESLNGDASQSIDLEAVAGQYFSYTFDSISSRSTDNVSADLGNASNWLSFSAQNFTLHGLTPSTLTNQTFNLSIIADAAAGTFTSQVRLHIEPAKVRHPTMSSSRSHSAPTTSTEATTSPSAITQLPAGNQMTSTRKLKIILVTVLTALAVLALIIFILCCIRLRQRKHNKRNGIEAQKELSARASFQTEPAPDTADLPPVVEEPRISNDRPRQVTPIQMPQIEPLWASDSLQKAKKRLSERIKKKNQGSIDSSWGELLAPPVSQAVGQRAQRTPYVAVLPSEALVRPPLVPSYSAKRQLQNGKRLSKQNAPRTERGSKALSTIGNHTVGLPNRLSGAGHGSGVLVPEQGKSMANRSSWQTTLASIPQGDARPSITTLGAFPLAPEDNKENEGLGIQVSATKTSMRLVEHSSELSNSFEIQRQRWHTDRARHRLEGASRFSNAGSSRAPSVTRLPNAVRSPSRTISPPIPEDATISSRLSQPSWSKWSGIGPAARAESSLDSRAPAPLFARQASRPTRDVSMASSGQFDSALSSDSQWEDENIVAEVNDAGERHWMSDAESGAPSPRLPFDPFSSSQEEVGQANQVGLSRGARLIDKRRHASIEGENIRRSEKSQAGSFRFI